MLSIKMDEKWLTSSFMLKILNILTMQVKNLKNSYTIAKILTLINKQIIQH
jgi:hypothetical protein